MNELLRIQNVSVTFPGAAGPVEAVSQLSFQLSAGEIFCLVGESGCGKSLTARAVLGLVPPPGQVSGSIFLEGLDLASLSPAALRRVRGRRIGMVFQEPMTALNPALRVGDQVAEALLVHDLCSAAQARQRVETLFRQAGIPAPEARMRDYPHQLSGGMRQRVMIAMALACEPQLLLADEPTTALDVTIQGQILHLLHQLSRRRRMGLLLITHDLGIVGQLADRVGVMYAGRLVETGPADAVLHHPLHPYTQGLMASAPARATWGKRLPVIPGTVPSPAHFPAGCRFHPRCPHAQACCRQQVPQLTASAHAVACWYAPPPSSPAGSCSTF